jgi:hypothetical protein
MQPDNCVLYNNIDAQGNNGKIKQRILVRWLPKSLGISGDSILCNKEVKTDRIIPNNKPFIVIHDNQEETCLVINISV